ncbi:unnamed protein product, partial [Haemonchus placei]|uniref:Uncharacterized protein n=1 Tax=Haemonchus placei TaxID=6290 RepID=A0A0N4WYV7_HAEPC
REVQTSITKKERRRSLTNPFRTKRSKSVDYRPELMIERRGLLKNSRD